LFEISPKVARNFSKSCLNGTKKRSTVAFSNESSQKKSKKKILLLSSVVGSDVKVQQGVRFQSIFVQFCGVTGVAK